MDQFANKAHFACKTFLVELLCFSSIYAATASEDPCSVIALTLVAMGIYNLQVLMGSFAQWIDVIGTGKFVLTCPPDPQTRECWDTQGDQNESA